MSLLTAPQRPTRGESRGLQLGTRLASLYLLGNTRGVFEMNYLDAMQVETPQPPEL